MRCPKCKFITSETNRVCPRCGEDLRALAEALGPFYKASGKEVILKESFLPPPSLSQPGPLESPAEVSNRESPPENPPLELELAEAELPPEKPLLEPEAPAASSPSGEEEPFAERPQEEPEPRSEIPKEESEDVLKELEALLEEDSQG